MISAFTLLSVSSKRVDSIVRKKQELIYNFDTFSLYNTVRIKIGRNADKPVY